MKNRVTLWWLETEGLAPDDWLGLESLLDESERERARRFHFERDRQTYIAAHALGRVLLSAQTREAPQSWRFAAGPHGKPELLLPGDGPRWRLNLSHTRGLAAAVLTQDHDVGVDVEWLERQPACSELSRRFFAAEECAALDAVPDEGKVEAFLTYWTLKESYIKAIGKGLAQPLDSFFFTLDPLSIHFPPGSGDKASQWLFRSLRPTSGHLLAMALHHPDPGQVAVTAEAAYAGKLLRPI